MAIGRAVVYYARAAHAFSAGIKCQHCRDYKNLVMDGKVVILCNQDINLFDFPEYGCVD